MIFNWLHIYDESARAHTKWKLQLEQTLQTSFFELNEKLIPISQGQNHF